MQFARCALIAVLLVGTGLSARTEGVGLTDAQIEDRFWTCDVLAIGQVLPPAEGAQCAQWSDELKQRRFGGDFNALLAWWRAHKQAEHAGKTAVTRRPQ